MAERIAQVVLQVEIPGLGFEGGRGAEEDRVCRIIYAEPNRVVGAQQRRSQTLESWREHWLLCFTFLTAKITVRTATLEHRMLLAACLADMGLLSIFGEASSSLL